MQYSGLATAFNFSAKATRLHQDGLSEVSPQRIDVLCDWSAFGTPGDNGRKSLMIDLKQSLAVLAVVLATTAFASPSYAQQNGRELSRARAQAIQECNRRAAPYWEWKWGDVEIYIYRSCMAEYGHSE